MNDFKGRQFEGQIVLWAVRWSCKYGVSYRELEEMLEERGVAVNHTTLFRWTQRYAPEIERHLRWYWRRPRSTSWRVDETYVKVRGRWAYLYRAVDKQGDTVEFHLSPTRNTKAAKRLLAKALRGLRASERPKVINTDKAPTYGVAIATLKKEGHLPKDTQHRQIQYLNNIVEADHGKLKRLTRPTLAFQSMKTAFATIRGFEVMRALKKGQGSLFRYQPGVAGEVSLVHRAFGLLTGQRSTATSACPRSEFATEPDVGRREVSRRKVRADVRFCITSLNMTFTTFRMHQPEVAMLCLTP